MTTGRVLVTGGTGFIGSHVVRALLDNGRDVAVLSRSGQKVDRLGSVSESVVHLAADLTDLASVRAAVTAWRPESCVHLAWYTEPGEYLESRENLSALQSTVTLVTELAEIGCKRVAIAGTCAEYELSEGWLTEDSPTVPRSLYAATKLSARIISEQIAVAAGMQLSWGRVFYPYGPGEDRRRLIPALTLSLLAGRQFKATRGEQIRDYVHVRDVATAFAALVLEPASGVYNISSGIPITVRALMERLEAAVGCAGLIQFGALPYRDWEPMFVCGDNSRLKSLGWAPCVSLDEGLRQAASWWGERS